MAVWEVEVGIVVEAVDLADAEAIVGDVAKAVILPRPEVKAVFIGAATHRDDWPLPGEEED